MREYSGETLGERNDSGPGELARATVIVMRNGAVENLTGAL
jgi:hypothetical protein